MAHDSHRNRFENGTDDDLFLPDFCAVRVVFSVVMIAELLAFVLLLAQWPRRGDPWADLSLISLFIQWIALSGAGLLCASRPWLWRLGDNTAGVTAYLLLLAVTAGVSEAGWWVLQSGMFLGTGGGHGHVSFLARNVVISAIISAVVLRYFYVQHQWKRKIEAENRARLAALQARIRPHFLFNSMNTIASLTRHKPDLAEQAVEDLADLFRETLSDVHAPVTFADERAFGERYLRLEKLRLGERLHVRWAVDGVPAGALLPALTLQPLLENAIYHGIEPLPEGGTIEVLGHFDPRRGIHLTITNPISGDNGTARPGNRIALDNVRQRLAAIHGESGRVQVHAGADRYVVELEFPYREVTA